MSPRISLNDRIDIPYRNPVINSELIRPFSSRPIIITYGYYISSRKHYSASSLSFSDAIRHTPTPVLISNLRIFMWSKNKSSLAHHVVGIVGMSSFKKMIWIYTDRIIAFVKRQKCFRHFPCVDMEQNTSSQKTDFSKRKNPVSLNDFRSSPYPAFADGRAVRLYRTVFIHVAPESSLVFFRQLRDWSCSHIAKSLSFVVSVFRRLISSGEREYFNGSWRVVNTS